MKYELLKDFTKEPTTDSISVNPHWIIAVVRYQHPITFSRAKIFHNRNTHENFPSVSFNNDNSILAKTSKPLIISNECIQLNVSSHKSNHITQLQAVLIESGINFLSAILPGDWLMAWMVNSKEQYTKVLDKLEQDESANAIDDGLKFVGRVHDIRKSLVQSPGGHRIVRYNLSGVGFGELDAQIFYDPHLAAREPSIGQYLSRLNINIQDIFNTAATEAQKGRQGIDSNRAIPVFLNTLVGTGIPESFAKRGELPLVTGQTADEDAPFAYVVPGEVGNWLGIKSRSKGTGMYSYADLLDLTIGVQKYQKNTGNISAFLPDGVSMLDGTMEANKNSLADTNRHFTEEPLKGTFLPMAVTFNNKTVWTILNDFLNPAINEMYTTLRLTAQGKVLPCIIVRQLPFSTPVMADKMKDKVTSFMELPRWVADPLLVKGLDIGRSDATHFNYLQIYGEAVTSGGLSLTTQTVLNPPLRDEQDIKRHGFRPYIQTVKCSLLETKNGPREWMAIVSDFVMGQHLTLNGVCTLAGIAAPICVGDNFEFENVLYHIESVQHSCSLQPGGIKVFDTTLRLTHGVRADLPATLARFPQHQISVSKKKRTNNWLDGVTKMLKSTKTEKGKQNIFAAIGSGDAALGERIYNEEQANSLADTENVNVVGEINQNPDLFLYSGIEFEDIQDNTAHNPELVVELEDNQ